MKKICIAILFYALTSSVCHSQTKLGLSFGVSNSTVDVSDYQNVIDTSQARFDGNLSQRFAVSAFLRLNNYFTLRPELSFINTVFRERLDSIFFNQTVAPGWTDRYNTKSEYNLQHLRLPVLLNFSFHLLTLSKSKSEEKKPSTLSIDLFAGPYISFAVTHKRKSSISHTRSSVGDTSKRFNFTNTSTEEKNLDNNQINRWDYGAIIGLGLKAGITKDIKVFIEARNTISSYQLNKGLWDRIVQKPNNPFETHVVSPKMRLRNSTILSVGVLFNLNFSKINISPER